MADTGARLRPRCQEQIVRRLRQTRIHRKRQDAENVRVNRSAPRGAKPYHCFLFHCYSEALHFVIQDKPLEHFGVKRLQAVLTESPDTKRADYPRKLIRDPIVSKNLSALFLFTSSEFFTSLDTIQIGEQEDEVQQVPRFPNWSVCLNPPPRSFAKARPPSPPSSAS